MREQQTLSDHPARMVVPSEYREPRDLCPDVNPLASALTRFAPASPLDSALTKNIPGGGGAPHDLLPSTLSLDFQLFSVNSFRLIHFRKNAPANPLVSHTFKTKDLKPSRFIHFQKKGRGSPHPANAVIPSEPAILAGDEGPQRSEGREPQSANHESPVANHESLPLSALTSTLTNFASATPLTSALTKTKDLKSFIINTYKKGVGQGYR